MISRAAFYWLAGAATLVMTYGGFHVKKSGELNLKHFTASEFGIWWPSMSTELVHKLDVLRDAIGIPIIISPAFGALGRVMGEDEGSQHNVTKWGEVRAADIMFPTAGKADLERIYMAALNAGFTGIGAYPDWKPHVGLHVDVRVDRIPGHPATWSGIKTAQGQKYFAIEQAFV
jgi:hypothetical protein